MTLTAGTRLGTYEILGPLGAGGMGEVYRAKDLRLRREVAIKVLPEDVAASPDRLARFEREARTVAGLNHPNIVTLHSVEDEDGVRFLTMELVEGQALSNLVVPSGLPLPRLLELAIPLTDALVAAHEKGVIHRDLKPGNVMVTREGRVKVLDFGLAKMMGNDAAAGHDATLTITVTEPLSGERHVMGTVPYMAPEQLRGEKVDARSDLFSLGIVLYELATGRRPFNGDSTVEISSSILRDTPEPPSRVRADLPTEFCLVVGQCLEKNPRERVQTALDVNNALRRMRKALERGEPEKPAPSKVASIAVLPFVNRSASADDEYFSDGLADELLNVLSKIKGLRVTARASSFHFKGKDTPVPEIGRILNVVTLLDGSVRKSGNRIRVSVQLVQVSDSSHIWSETYDRTLEDIFAVQDDIAQSVVKELRTTLLGEAADSEGGAVKAEVAKAAKGRGTDPDAHRLYLLARHLLERYTREDTSRAIEYLKEALTRDPAHALALADLSRARAREASEGWVPVAEGMDRAREAVERALSLNPDLPEGHVQIGWIRMSYDWDFLGAEASMARALELTPANAIAFNAAGLLAKAFGRLDRAIGFYRRALEQDPLSSVYFRNLGSALEDAGRFGEAEAAYRSALELAPQSAGMTRGNLSLTLLALGRDEDALAEGTRGPDGGVRSWAQAIVHHGLGHVAESGAALQELIEECSENMAYQIAQVFAVHGEADRAFEWLERAYAERDPGLTWMKSTRHLRSLHSDPRWGAFLKKMGLED